MAKERKSKSGIAKQRTLPREQRVSHRFSAITRRLDQTLAAMHFKKLGITISNWKIMRVIACGPLSATELGNRTSVDADKITRAVDTLVERGYVIRKEDEADRRKVVLTLSAKGRRIYDRIDRIAAAIEADFLSVLNGEERKALLMCLDKLDRQSEAIFERRESPYGRRKLGAVRAIAPARTKSAGRPSARKRVAAASVRR